MRFLAEGNGKPGEPLDHFQFSLWDSDDIVKYIFGVPEPDFQFSLWDSIWVSVILVVDVPAFNSLYEIRIQTIWLYLRFLELSILFMRFLTGHITGAIYPASFNSLYEIRLAKLYKVIQAYLSFNSLYEIRKLKTRGLLAGQTPFNSLYEIHNRRLRLKQLEHYLSILFMRF